MIWDVILVVLAIVLVIYMLDFLLTITSLIFGLLWMIFWGGVCVGAMAISFLCDCFLKMLEKGDEKEKK